MYTISELEFIGESLPKINANFSELDTRATAVTNVANNLVALSSTFYTNDSTKFVGSQNNDSTTGLTLTKIRKSDIISSLTTPIIYPMSLYFHLEYITPPANNEYVKFKVDFTGNGVFNTVSQSEYLSAEKLQLFSFTDLGFKDWELEWPTGSNQQQLNIVYRYST